MWQFVWQFFPHQPQALLSYPTEDALLSKMAGMA
jgi:hypothetical protein